MGQILVVDDNDTLREGMTVTLDAAGHEVVAAPSGEAALEAYKRAPADLVITDLKMAPMDGLALLRALREHDPEATVMVVTAFGTVETAVEAMQAGAFDFITKPFSPGLLRAKAEKGVELSGMRRQVGRLQAQNAALRDALGGEGDFGELVGESPGLQGVFKACRKVGPTDASVHIHGESGTGKELVAKALHLLSPRREGPFVKVNCGALTDSLLESELFGHEKGAFTGAIKRKLGRFELADGGTLFLDEVGDVSPAMQLKLLRVLQEREFERVGGEQTQRVDVRVISATHRDLKARVAEGTFREDLFYRLHVVPITLPPLRERGDDLRLLAEHFLAKTGQRMGRTLQGFSAAALARLSAHPWPGNVRELENAIEQIVVFAEGELVEVDDLPAFLQDPRPARGQTPTLGSQSLPALLEEIEAQLIREAWAQAGGVKTQVARLLGIKTSALYYKLDKYGIGPERGHRENEGQGAETSDF